MRHFGLTETFNNPVLCKLRNMLRTLFFIDEVSVRPKVSFYNILYFMLQKSFGTCSSLFIANCYPFYICFRKLSKGVLILNIREVHTPSIIIIRKINMNTQT